MAASLAGVRPNRNAAPELRGIIRLEADRTVPHDMATDGAAFPAFGANVAFLTRAVRVLLTHGSILLATSSSMTSVAPAPMAMTRASRTMRSIGASRM